MENAMMQMNVPMLDLTEQYASLKQEINQTLEEIISGSRFILGSHVKQLEEDIATFSNVHYGIGVASGSDALHISLLACGIQPGDEVIVPSFTFFATAGAVARAGAIPVFVDIDPKTYNIDPEKVKEAITDKTAAIIPVHLYGQMADMDPIVELARKHHLAIIEDAAQAIGSAYKGKSPGELGTAACYSFFPTKNLGAYGDGGMIVTKDEEIAETAKVIRVHGSKPKYYHHILGLNSRLDELQAGVLNVKFRYLKRWNELRTEKAGIYTSLFSDYLKEGVVTPYVEAHNEHVFHQYTIRAERRNELQQFLKERGVSTMVYYPQPLHLQPVFHELGYQPGDLPEAERAAREALSLPMFPELTLEQQEYVVEQIASFYNK